MTAKLVFLDCETTSLRYDRRAWEIGFITRELGVTLGDIAPGLGDVEQSFFIDAADLDLGNADPMSLKIGRFYDRHPQFNNTPYGSRELLSEYEALRRVESATRGAHIVGAVPNFDTETLGTRMRARRICPSWHHHLIDVEALAVGWLHRHAAVLENRQANVDEAAALRETAKPPWRSDDLSRAIGVDPDKFDRHTALGDAAWAMAIYDTIVLLTGGAP